MFAQKILTAGVIFSSLLVAFFLTSSSLLVITYNPRTFVYTLLLGLIALASMIVYKVGKYVQKFKKGEYLTQKQGLIFVFVLASLGFFLSYEGRNLWLQGATNMSFYFLLIYILGIILAAVNSIIALISLLILAKSPFGK